jgi:hypothetical protein
MVDYVERCEVELGWVGGAVAVGVVRQGSYGGESGAGRDEVGAGLSAGCLLCGWALVLDRAGTLVTSVGWSACGWVGRGQDS